MKKLIICLGILLSSFTQAQTNCSSAINVCNQNAIFGNSLSFGTQELNFINQGCLLGNEHQSTWYRLNILNSGTLRFNINPQGSADYDFALYGPNSPCPPTGPPIRCSFSATQFAGLNPIAPVNEFSDGTNGPLDGWVYPLNVIAGQTYYLLVDNFSNNGVGFSLGFGGTPSGIIGCTPLPVELLIFDGFFNGNENELFWLTATETNSDYFELQRSVDNFHWETLKRLEAAENSLSSVKYRTTDDSFLRAINYYRLRQIDLDQNEQYSETITIDNLYSINNNVVSTTNSIGQDVGSQYKGLVFDRYKSGYIRERMQ